MAQEIAQEFSLGDGGPFLITTVVFFFVLVLAEVLALYLHLAGFTVMEVVLLVALPLLAYLSALPLVGTAIRGLTGSMMGTVLATARVFDLPLVHLDRSVIGVNLVGFAIPTIISAKMLLQRRVPWKQFCLLTTIIAGVTYLYSAFQPGLGVVIYFFAIPSILAAGIAFMLRKIKGAGGFNPALLAYSGATIGVLLGADLLNLYKLASHQWGRPVFISIGGGSVLDAIFLAGIVALFADLIFRSQEENILANVLRLFRGGHR
jgi:uncharacterized membrane protein